MLVISLGFDDPCREASFGIVLFRVSVTREVRLLLQLRECAFGEECATDVRVEWLRET